MNKTNYFHFRWVKSGLGYDLGQSNSSSLATGGVCIGAFLEKDGQIIDGLKEGETADRIVWSIARASDKENYWRKKARQLTLGKAKKGSEVLYSQNWDYNVVKEIAIELAKKVETDFSTHKNAGNFWNHIKNSFSIDGFVNSGMKKVNTTVLVQPLHMFSENIL